MDKVYIGEKISLEDVYKVSSDLNLKVQISEKAKKKVLKNREKVEKILKEDKAVYGINTGFGSLSSVKIEKDQIKELQKKLILSHSCGVGDLLEEKYIRAMIFLRAQNASLGFSGVRLELIETLTFFLNNNIIPLVPRKGSVGASGDLAPLAHLCLALIGEGEVLYKGRIEKVKEVFDKLNFKPLVLEAKEGLALINGTQFMASNGCIFLNEIKNILKQVDVVAALSVEGTLSSFKAFDIKISELRPHEGQLAVSRNMEKLSKGSEILKAHKDCNKVQDPYSFRCIPQVHGAVRDAILYLEKVLNVEINSVTDNPIVFDEEIISGGNFHGEPLALAMDFAAIALTDLCSIIERRIDKMLNPLFNGNLPAYLVKKPGVNSGFMIAQYTAAALLNENKVLSHPASVDSVPTSNNKEDHVSMGATSANKLIKIIENLKNILAIELLVSTEACSQRKEGKTSSILQIVMSKVREKGIRPLDEDRALYKDINLAKQLIESNHILEGIEIE
jgi:histidine ammonia-lyase